MTPLLPDDELERRKAAIVAKYGPWTGHNIRLSERVQTIGPAVATIELRVKRFMQLIADLMPRPIDELRILDLACGEGLYAIEFARHGATVVGIEAREANIEKARFVKDALGLDKLELIQGDVREISPDRNGMFDVILCAGILYHLDAADLFTFAETMAAMTTRLLIIDTHAGAAGAISHTWNGRFYRGDSFVEHAEQTTPEQRLANKLASVDNTTSLWLTRASLYNLLGDIGFTSVLESHMPVTYDTNNRIVLAALKGVRPHLHSVPPELNDSREREPEKDEWEAELAKRAAPVEKGIGKRISRLLNRRL